MEKAFRWTRDSVVACFLCPLDQTVDTVARWRKISVSVRHGARDVILIPACLRAGRACLRWGRDERGRDVDVDVDVSSGSLLWRYVRISACVYVHLYARVCLSMHIDASTTTRNVEVREPTPRHHPVLQRRCGIETF